MAERWQVQLVWVVPVVLLVLCCTTGPGTAATARLMFKGVEVPEHSQVVREEIGTANADTLMCVSDYSPCCTDNENSWRYAGSNGPGVTPVDSFYHSRGDGVVRLHNGGSAGGEGIFRCDIRSTDGAGGIQTLFVGIYPSVGDDSGTGPDGTVTVDCTGGTFTLTSGPEADSPEFTLSGCSASGGAVREFSCTSPGGDVNGTTDGIDTFINIQSNRQPGSYDFSVSVTGNYPGDYTCQATVYRYDGTGDEPQILFYPETPGSAQTITVPAADPPTGLTAIRNGTALRVTWTPPSPTPYGYRIFYRAVDGQAAQQSVVVVDGSVASYDVPIPQGDTEYRVSIQTLSDTELPSALTEETVTAALIVTVLVDYTPPVDFVHASKSDYRAASGPVTLTCQVEGATGIVSYQWNSTCTHINCFVTGTTESISRTFLRAGIDDGTHTCTATDGDGGETGSDSTVMNIIGVGVYVQTGDDTLPTGTLTNNGIVVATASNNFLFQCRSGYPVYTDPSLAEFIGVDGSVLSNGASGGLNPDNNPFAEEMQSSVIRVQSRSTLSPLTAEEEGVYTCRMRDENNDTVEVNVGVYRNGFNTPPSITSMTFDPDLSTLTCTSTGSPATTVTWMKDGSPLDMDGTTYSMEQTVTERGTSTYDNTLTVISGGEDDVGTYSCEVENVIGASGPASIVVSALSIDLTSTGSLTVGSTDYFITCTVTVFGLTGTPSITWTDPDGTMISTDTDFTVGAVTGSGPTYSSVLMFNSLKTSLAGEYTCSATFDSQTAMGVTAVIVTVDNGGGGEEGGGGSEDNTGIIAGAIGAVAVMIVVIVIAITIVVIVVLVLRQRRAELSIKIRGGSVKGDVDTKRIGTLECPAYGAPESLPLQDLTAPPDYEIITLPIAPVLRGLNQQLLLMMVCMIMMMIHIMKPFLGNTITISCMHACEVFYLLVKSSFMYSCLLVILCNSYIKQNLYASEV